MDWYNCHIFVCSLEMVRLLVRHVDCGDPGRSADWNVCVVHNDVIKWKHLPRYWPFVRGIHRSPVNSPHNGLWRGAFVFYLMNRQLSEQSWGRWFKTPSLSLWRRCNGWQPISPILMSQYAIAFKICRIWNIIFQISHYISLVLYFALLRVHTKTSSWGIVFIFRQRTM